MDEKNEAGVPQPEESAVPEDVILAESAGTKLLYDIADIVRTAVIAIMVVFCFAFRFVGVFGPSMEPTLEDGDWLLVTAITDSVKRGDIIVSTQDNAFHEPIIKRVIALGGQTVDLDLDKGVVIVDGRELDEDDYIMERIEIERDVEFPLTVPEGEVFVLGDNRNDSADSRSSSIGTIDEDYILGRAFVRLLPYDKFGAINK